ncbi:hypothetical protein, partial [Cobetia sp. 29-18-1]
GTEEASRLAEAPTPSQHATAARHQRAAQDTDSGRRGGARREDSSKRAMGQRSSDQRGSGQPKTGQRSGARQEGAGRRERT